MPGVQVRDLSAPDDVRRPERATVKVAVEFPGAATFAAH